MPLRFLPLTLLVAALVPVHSQSTPATSYEIASVRRNMSGASRSSFQLPERGTVTGTNVSVYAMILQAYQITRFTVVVRQDNPLVDRGPAAPAFDM